MRKWTGLFIFGVLFWTAVFSALAAPKEHAGSGFAYTLRQDGTAIITRYTGEAKVLSIPSRLDGYTVTALGEDVFPKGFGVASILIPAGIMEISEGTFRFLDTLAAIEVIHANPVYASTQGVLFDKKQKLLHTYPRDREGVRYGIPRGIEAIAKSAFYQCQRLEGVFISGSVVTVGDEAFYGCKKLTNIRLPDSVQTIGGRAFGGCIGLYFMDIPKDVSHIGPGAFLRCANMEDIRVDEDNPSYVSFNGTLVEKETKLLHTFLHKKAGVVVRIPGGIKTIGPMAFSDCFLMKEVTVPASVVSIGEEAFAYCYNMTSIILPESVTDMGRNVFMDCMRVSMIVAEGSAAHQYAVEGKIPFVIESK